MAAIVIISIAAHPVDNNVVYAGRFRFDSIQANNNYVLMAKKVSAMYPGNGDIVYSVEASGANTRYINQPTEARVFRLIILNYQRILSLLGK